MSAKAPQTRAPRPPVSEIDAAQLTSGPSTCAPAASALSGEGKAAEEPSPERIAEWDRQWSRHVFRVAHLMLEKFGPDAYEEASRRFLVAWHTMTDEPGDEVLWFRVLEALRVLVAVDERAC